MKMYQMSDLEYFATRGFSNSAAKLIAKSPLHFSTNNFKGSPATRIGTAVHAKLLLTPGGWDEEIKVFDGAKTLTSKAGLEFTLDNPEYTVITSGENDIANDIVDAQRPGLRAFFRQTMNERAIIGEIEGIPVKCKVDAFRPERNLMYDIKTTASLDKFKKNFYDLGYHTQAAWYLKLARLAGIEIDNFYFWVVETSRPYCSQFVKASEEVLEDGLEDVEAAFKTYKDCYLKDDFTQGYSNEILTIERPAWRRRR